MKLNAAQQAAVERHKAEDARQLANDINAVLATPQGRRLFIAMIFQGGVYTHTRRGDDHTYLAGRRDACLELMSVANEFAAAQVLIARKERHDLISARNAELRGLQQKGNDQ